MESLTHFMQYSPYIALAGFLFALGTYYWVLRQSAGNSEMMRIAELIESGSMAFLKKEYTFLAVFLAIVTMILGFHPNSAGIMQHVTWWELWHLWGAALLG